MVQLATVELIPGIRVVSVRGELDILTAHALGKTISLELAAGPRGVILDLTEVAYLGSSGISALLRAREAAFRSDVPLRLVCLPRSGLRPLAATGVVGLFAISPTLTDALTYHNVDTR